MIAKRREEPCGDPRCDNKALARNMCSTHYQRWRKGTYDPSHDVTRSYPVGIEEQFATHTETVGGCLLWTGRINNNGYGRVSLGKKKRGLAHRVAYERHIGPIPEGHVIDHTCHNLAVRSGACVGGPACLHRTCVNPDHLEAVTQGENLMRSGLVGGTRG